MKLSEINPLHKSIVGCVNSLPTSRSIQTHEEYSAALPKITKNNLSTHISKISERKHPLKLPEINRYQLRFLEHSRQLTQFSEKFVIENTNSNDLNIKH